MTSLLVESGLPGQYILGIARLAPSQLDSPAQNRRF